MGSGERAIRFTGILSATYVIISDTQFYFYLHFPYGKILQ